MTSDAAKPMPPRLFIAATEQNTGKTTTALGLYAALRERFARISFIKPVGQRFVAVEGKQIDEDSVLIRDTFGTQVDIEHMSPIAVEPEFTRRYINHANNDALVRLIQHAFDRGAWEKDFALIEGTGHAGVGSVFDLSNARVASILKSKVLLITPAGIGRPIDEGALNKALFDQANVEVIGVIMNKVRPEKMESISDTARRGFERLGLELLGVIPQEKILAQPTLQQVCTHIGGEFFHGGNRGRSLIGHVLIGAMSSANLFRDVKPRTLLIVPGDREDAVLAALSRSLEPDGGSLCGIILSDDMRPGERLLDMLRESSLPVICSSLGSYEIASGIHSMTVKTLPGDTEKIGRIQSLISQYVNIPRILAKIG